MNLSIIGGEFRGRPLKSPKSTHTRPTTAVLRKSVFDICKNQICEARFLDLFAGSGAIGIEALSRGAAHVTFVEKDKMAFACLKENIQKFQIEERSTLLHTDALSALEKLEIRKKHFDLIYIDPPYDEQTWHLDLLTLLDTLQLAQGATIFIEEALPSLWEKESPNLKHFLCKNKRRFGRSLLHQYIPRG